MAKDKDKGSSSPSTIPTVVKANHLIEARFEIDFASYRLIHAIATKLDSWPGAPAVTPEQPFRIHASEFAALFGMSQNRAYASLKEAAERLAELWVVIEKPSPDSPGSPVTKSRWVSAITYREKTGEIELYFAHLILPYLTELASRFTRYELCHIAPLTSVYAIRIYELLAQYRSVGSREMRIDWLKACLQLGDKYDRITNLKARVIGPAVEQINEHTDLWVKYEQRKRGRVVEALIFSFGQKANASPAACVDTKKNRSLARISRAYIQQNAKPGESWDQAEARLRREAADTGDRER